MTTKTSNARARIRIDYAQRYHRRMKWRYFWECLRDIGYYSGTLLAAMIAAVGYIGAIAILCGY